MAFIIILALIVIFQACVAADNEYRHAQCFEPPFEDLNAAGLRQVSPNWRTAADTEVNRHFIRLTPDRQSKRGAIWGNTQIGVNSISTVLQFRISGQGKTFFGDGIGLWITQQSYYREGTLHGSQEKFTGIGIIFDTFRNVENIAAHRDVTVLVNDGTKTYEMMTENVQGCNTNVRYHNERADFSVTDSSSKAKITIIDGKSLHIAIDARNQGSWTECITIPDLQLPETWLERSFIGITATTGALADNHDVLSLKTLNLAGGNITDAASAGLQDFETAGKDSLIHIPEGTSVERQLDILANVVSSLRSSNLDLDHAYEHKHVEIMDHVKTILDKLQKREAEAEKRIEKLETFVREEISMHLAQRLEEVERITKDNVDRKMRRLESSVHRKMEEVQSNADEAGDTIVKTLIAAEGAWRYPFYGVVLLLVIAAVMLYLWYDKMRKQHLM